MCPVDEVLKPATQSVIGPAIPVVLDIYIGNVFAGGAGQKLDGGGAVGGADVGGAVGAPLGLGLGLAVGTIWLATTSAYTYCWPALNDTVLLTPANEIV